MNVVVGIFAVTHDLPEKDSIRPKQKKDQIEKKIKKISFINGCKMRVTKPKRILPTQLARSCCYYELNAFKLMSSGIKLHCLSII
jgi:hypothetical protein